jgi:hypothetical protein
MKKLSEKLQAEADQMLTHLSEPGTCYRLDDMADEAGELEAELADTIVAWEQRGEDNAAYQKEAAYWNSRTLEADVRAVRAEAALERVRALVWDGVPCGCEVMDHCIRAILEALDGPPTKLEPRDMPGAFKVREVCDE